VCYEIYVPNDLETHPEIILVSRNSHSYPDPRPTRTPETIKKMFRALLQDTGWRLADITPRKLSLDAGFMANFRLRLNWQKEQDPPLSSLHPSLGNFDRVSRLIEELREEHFPDGTGLKGRLTFAFITV